MSKQIRALEEELGATLFERTKRQVRLTPVGLAFVKEARQALLHSQRAASVAKTVQGAPLFRLGYTPFIDLQRIGRIRAASAADFGGVLVELISCYAGNPVEQIEAGELEAGLVLLPAGKPRLSVEWLWTEVLYAVLPVRHKLVGVRQVRLRELQSMSFISIGGKLYPALDAHLMNCCAQHGLCPDRVQDVSTFAEAVAMVADGLGFTFARCWPERLSNPDVAFKRIEHDPLALETGLVFGNAARPEIVDRLFALLVSKRDGLDVLAQARLFKESSGLAA